MRTSPGPGSPVSTSSRRSTSGPPVAWKRMAWVMGGPRVANGDERIVRLHSLVAIRYSPRSAPMTDPAHALMLQFLAWVAEGPRSYADAMEAWRSTCPRLSIWEDAILDRLIEFSAGGAGRNQSRVVLTARGRAKLV